MRCDYFVKIKYNVLFDKQEGKENTEKGDVKSKAEGDEGSVRSTSEQRDKSNKSEKVR